MAGKWAAIVAQGGEIVRSYDTGVTLRQLFYRLVAAEVIPNTKDAYNLLSRYTARARRDGAFPDLLDQTRRIHRDAAFASPERAQAWLAGIYRRDRTEGQPWSVYLGVEKAGMVAQLRAWFGRYGVPVLALGGYASQSYTRRVQVDVTTAGRPAVLIYAGDFDPSGEDIDRDFIARSGCFAKAVRVALSAEQVRRYGLPPQVGKSTDSRAGAFEARHGRLLQVELDALDPATLRSLFAQAAEGFWDWDAWKASVRRERADRGQLRPPEGAVP
jgi:hypothetical protein